MAEKLKVLVVDDDRRMVKTICDILRVKGYEAAQAFSGEEAVDKANSEEPDCVLMDIRMPGIDGVDALKMIKEIVPGLPVLLMSAYATGEQAEEAKRQGAYAVLAKPIDIQLLLSFLSLKMKEESILVVDDDPLFCKTLQDNLEARGYRVETEGDAAKVLGQMAKEYKLLVVLDLKLGNVSGVDVLKSIRAKYPGKPVILVTGNKGELTESIESYLGVEAYTCLYKPFETEKLLSIIEEISRRKLRSLLGEQF